MNSQSRFLKKLIWVSGAFFVLALAALIVLNEARKSRAEMPVYGQLPDFSYIEQNGKQFGRADMLGKVSIVDFIFTRCQGPCPVMATKMGELYKLFSGTSRVQFISVTVDPENDSPDVLQAYAQRQGVNDSRWIFLNGPIDSVKNLSENGFKIAADDLPAGHTTSVLRLTLLYIWIFW